MDDEKRGRKNSNKNIYEEINYYEEQYEKMCDDILKIWNDVIQPFIEDDRTHILTNLRNNGSHKFLKLMLQNSPSVHRVLRILEYLETKIIKFILYFYIY